MLGQFEAKNPQNDQPVVFHIVPTPNRGGAERIVRELTAQLPDYGIQTYALYYKNPDGAHLTNREYCLDIESVRGVSAIKNLRKWLKIHMKPYTRPIVHAHLTWPCYHISALSSKFDGPIVYTEHSTHNKRREYGCLRPLERTVYRRFDRIVAISQATEDSLVDWLADPELARKIVTIQNGSRMLPFVIRKPPTSKAVRLISIGSLTRHKGFDFALQAVAQLGDQIEMYTILGEGPERARLEALADKLGIRDKLRMPGQVSNVAKHLHAADLGVIPSRWEGFGLVAVEALSTGLPLVASDVPGLSDVVTGCDAVVLVPPADVQGLETWLRYAIADLVGRNEIARAARIRAEQFTSHAMVSMYAELYREILSPRIS